MIRELFVEVAESLLEGAMREREERERKKAEAIAQVNADLVLSRLHFDFAHTIRMLAAQADLKLIDVTRDAHDMQILVRVRLPCGHAGRIWIDEVFRFVAVSTAELCDYIYETLTKTPTRKCFCVQREILQPCVPGVCK